MLKKDLKVNNCTDVINCNGINGESMMIGTSSLRRIAQLRHKNERIRIEDMRGNINTRLSKLDDPNGKFSALILATAGLKRGGFGDRVSHRLIDDWYYAVGQGVIAVECLTNNQFIIDLLRPITHLNTTLECIAERTLMKHLEGGCSVPIGVESSWNGDVLTLRSAVFSLNGDNKVENCISVDVNQVNDDSSQDNYTTIVLYNPSDSCLVTKFKNSSSLGHTLAQQLLQRGAKQILDSIKQCKTA